MTFSDAQHLLGVFITSKVKREVEEITEVLKNTSVDLTTSSNANRNVTFDCGLSSNLDLCPDCVESFKHQWANETVIPITKKRGKKDGADRKTT